MIMLETGEAFALAAGGMLAGLALLVKGGGWTIDSASHIASRFGVSQMLIGFTIVAFGTSLPELLVSIDAHLNGLTGVSLGNVVGSNIANILLVIGLTAALTGITSRNKGVINDIVAMMLATLGIAALLASGYGISKIAGIIMILLLVGYVVREYFHSRGKPQAEPDDDEGPAISFKNLGHAFLFLALGLAGVALGANFVVRGAKISAELLGVPDAVIGLTVVAFGTSVPELSTCIVAAAKGRSAIVLGNVLGSNFFNILLILGATSIIKPVLDTDIAPQIVNFDMWVMLGTSAIFSILLLFMKSVPRWLGIVYTLSYVAYIAMVYGFYLI